MVTVGAVMMRVEDLRSDVRQITNSIHPLSPGLHTHTHTQAWTHAHAGMDTRTRRHEHMNT